MYLTRRQESNFFNVNFWISWLLFQANFASASPPLSPKSLGSSCQQDRGCPRCPPCSVPALPLPLLEILHLVRVHPVSLAECNKNT